MSSGTRLVLGFLLFAAVAFGILETYGLRSLSRRGQDTPAAAARAAIQADNTVVGLVGGIEAFEPEEDFSADSSRSRVVARVLGGRDSGRMTAELAPEGERWRVLNAWFILSDGTTIPVAGSAGR